MRTVPICTTTFSPLIDTLACALAQHALRRRYRAIYRRTSRFFDELARGRARWRDGGTTTGTSTSTGTNTTGPSSGGSSKRRRRQGRLLLLARRRLAGPARAVRARQVAQHEGRGVTDAIGHATTRIDRLETKVDEHGVALHSLDRRLMVVEGVRP